MTAEVQRSDADPTSAVKTRLMLGETCRHRGCGVAVIKAAFGFSAQVNNI